MASDSVMNRLRAVAGLVLVVAEPMLHVRVGSHEARLFRSTPTTNGSGYTARCSCGWKTETGPDKAKLEIRLAGHVEQHPSEAEAPDVEEVRPGPVRTGPLASVRLVLAAATEARTILAAAKAAVLAQAGLHPEQEAALIIEHARLDAQAEFGRELLAALDRLENA